MFFSHLIPHQRFKSSAKIRIVLSAYDALEAEAFLLSCVLLVVDVETIPDRRLMNVVGFCGMDAKGEIITYVFPLYSDKNPDSGCPVDLDTYFAVIRKVLASGIPTACHNGAYDMFWLIHYNLPCANYAYDTMTMFWALAPELPKGLAFVASVLLDDYQYWKGDGKSTSWHTFLMYNGKDCDRTLRCLVVLIEILMHYPDHTNNFVRAHLRVINGISMSVRGVNADLKIRAKHGEALKAEAAKRLERLRYLVANPEFNPRSPAQKVDLVYTKLGAKPRNARGRFVKTIKEASAGAIPLRAIKSDHPIVNRVVTALLEAQEPDKQISNVIGIKIAQYQGHDRFYTSYNGTGTTTERYSASESPIRIGTNSQNIRKEYRNWLRADPGCFLLDIDFSAGDDVFVTFESADPEKIKVFRSGLDTHSVNATLFFTNWTYDQVVAGKKARDDRVVHPITGIRQITKKLSHGCNYLMAELTLLFTAGREAIVAAAKELGHADSSVWVQEALANFCGELEQKYRNHYVRFSRHGSDTWYADLYREFIATGGFKTAFGYFQRFLASPGDQGVIRGLAATAGQAGTAGRINMAMEELILGRVTPRFRDAENPAAGERAAVISYRTHGVDLRLQTHDSLTFNVNPSHPDWREGVANIYTALKRQVIIKNKLTGQFEEFAVGLESEVGTGWGKDLYEVKGNSLEAVELTLSKVSI